MPPWPTSPTRRNGSPPASCSSAACRSCSYVQSLRRREAILLRDAQVRGFFWLVLITTTMMSLWLWHKQVFALPDAIRISMFNIVSILTTTGFGLTDFGVWTPFTTVLFVFLMLFGACSGSTSGGLKIFRIQVAATLFHKQAKQLMHPLASFPRSTTVARSMTTSSALWWPLCSVMWVVILIASALLALFGLSPITAISGADHGGQ